MKKLIKKIFILSKIVIVVLLVMSVAVDGAVVTGRLLAGCDEIDQPENNNTPQFQQGPPAPEELPGNMDDNSKPYTEQSAILQADLFIKSDNTTKSYKLFFSKVIVSKSFTSLENCKSSIIHNSHQVSSRLGRQFTLVGAKPSGTS